MMSRVKNTIMSGVHNVVIQLGHKMTHWKIQSILQVVLL